MNYGPRMRIRAQLNNLNGVSLSIAKWLLQFDEIQSDPADLTTGMIARELEVSRAAVVRFAQKLGYTGFVEFRNAWIQETKPPSFQPEQNQPLPKAMDAAVKMTSAAINDLLTSLNTREWRRAVEMICTAKTITWYGVGQSRPIAMMGDQRLTAALRYSRMVNDFHELNEVAPVIGDGDVIIIVSHTGIWKNITELLEPCKGRGTKIIVLTGQPDSVIGRFADLVLLAPSREITVNKSAQVLYGPKALLMDMLLFEVIQQLAEVSVFWGEKKLQD
ncbi:MAG: MurR/RpiR family transcriptional regulator [Limnochordia bacterium]|nr:MurR/RpiR family transcriptional regulator [Limnochordia bacterium]